MHAIRLRIGSGARQKSRASLVSLTLVPRPVCFTFLFWEGPLDMFSQPMRKSSSSEHVLPRGQLIDSGNGQKRTLAAVSGAEPWLCEERDDWNFTLDLGTQCEQKGMRNRQDALDFLRQYDSIERLSPPDVEQIRKLVAPNVTSFPSSTPTNSSLDAPFQPEISLRTFESYQNTS